MFYKCLVIVMREVVQNLILDFWKVNPNYQSDDHTSQVYQSWEPQFYHLWPMSNENSDDLMAEILLV